MGSLVGVKVLSMLIELSGVMVVSYVRLSRSTATSMRYQYAVVGSVKDVSSAYSKVDEVDGAITYGTWFVTAPFRVRT